MGNMNWIHLGNGLQEEGQNSRLKDLPNLTRTVQYRKAGLGLGIATWPVDHSVSHCAYICIYKYCTNCYADSNPSEPR